MVMLSRMRSRDMYPCRMFSLELLATLILLSSVSGIDVSSASAGHTRGVSGGAHRPIYLVHKSGDTMDNGQRGETSASVAEIGYRAAGVVSLKQASSAEYVPAPHPETTTSPTADVKTGNLPSCARFDGGDESKFHTVALLRTSPQFLAESMSGAPITFSVDCTIISIAIEIKGTNALGASIWDPTGDMINKRLKRSAEHSHHQTASPTSTLSQLSSRPEIDAHVFPRTKSTGLQAPHLHHRRRQDEKQANPHQWADPRFDLQQISHGHMQNRNIRLYSQKTLQQNYHSHSEDWPNNQKKHHDNLHKQQSSQHQQQEKHHHHQRLHLSLKPEANEKHLQLHHSSASSTVNLPSYSRLKPAANEKHLQLHHSSASSTINLPSYSRLKPAANEKHPQLHHSSYSSTINLPSYSRLKPTALDDKTRHNRGDKIFPHFRPPPEWTWMSRGPSYRNQQIPLLLLNQSQTYIKSRDNVYPGSLEQRLSSHRFRPTIASLPYINTTTTRRQDGGNTDAFIHNRHRRAATILSMELSDGAVVWEIIPPTPGLWSLTVGGPEPVQITVTAVSSLDFAFQLQLLDNGTVTSRTSQPLAYDLIIARVTFTSPGCVDNVTMMSLYDDVGHVIATVEPDAVGLDRIDQDGRAAILIKFQMPDVPFFMSVSGYDVTRNKFQRLSSVRVVPRMFTLSPGAFSSGLLLAGNCYTFGVRLRNNGQLDRFMIMARCDNTACQTSSINPDVLQTAQGQSSYLNVIVWIPSSIYVITKGTLTVAAVRMSDNLTETLSFEVIAEPRSFLQDRKPPICTTISTSGGCRIAVPCLTQEWNMSVSVIDSLTGVSSAEFVEPPNGSFSHVQYLYSMTNRTARADYRYNCCKVEATLLVYDYANNPSVCSLLAPSLDSPQTTTMLYPEITNTLTSPITGISSISPITSILYSSLVAVKSSIRPSIHVTSSQTQFSVTWTSWPSSAGTRKSLDTAEPENAPSSQADGQSSSQTRRSSRSSSPPGQTETPVLTSGSSTDLTTYTGSSNFTASASNNGTSLVKSLQGQLQTDSARSKVLRLAAIICASVGGAAGLAIAVLCFIYRCINVRQSRRRHRRSSNVSDVTMGSSSESRCEASSDAGSIRLSNIESKGDNLLREPDSYRIRKTKKVGCHVDDTSNEKREHMDEGQDVENEVRGHRHPLHLKTVQRASGRGHTHSVHLKTLHTFAGRSQAREDVNFKCAVVKICDELDKPVKCGPKVDCLTVTLNPTLSAGKKTNTRKLQICAQVEKVDRPKINLSSIVSDLGSNVKRDLSKNVPRDTAAPGAPQLKRLYNKSQETDGKSSGDRANAGSEESVTRTRCQRDDGNHASGAETELLTEQSRLASTRDQSHDVGVRLSETGYQSHDVRDHVKSVAVQTDPGLGFHGSFKYLARYPVNFTNSIFNEHNFSQTNSSSVATPNSSSSLGSPNSSSSVASPHSSSSVASPHSSSSVASPHSSSSVASPNSSSSVASPNSSSSVASPNSSSSVASPNSSSCVASPHSSSSVASRNSSSSVASPHSSSSVASPPCSSSVASPPCSSSVASPHSSSCVASPHSSSSVASRNSSSSVASPNSSCCEIFQDSKCIATVQNQAFINESNSFSASTTAVSGLSVGNIFSSQMFLSENHSESDKQRCSGLSAGVMGQGIMVSGPRPGTRKHVHNQRRAARARKSKAQDTSIGTWQQTRKQHPKHNSSKNIRAKSSEDWVSIAGKFTPGVPVSNPCAEAERFSEPSDSAVSNCVNIGGNILCDCGGSPHDEGQHKTHPTTTPSPSPRAENNTALRLVQQKQAQRVISHGSQKALRHDLEQIRLKLFNFQNIIDPEVDAKFRPRQENMNPVCCHDKSDRDRAAPFIDIPKYHQ